MFITDKFTIDPLGIGYLSSYLKANGYGTDIVHGDYENVIDKVKSYQPDMLCYSVTTGKHVYYRDLNLQIKNQTESKALSVFGGPHVTFFPEFCLEPGVDVGVRGEGFDAIVEIACSLEKGHKLDNLFNIVVGNHKNELRPLMPKSNLLFPDRELIYKYLHNYNNPIKNVMCSFYCPMMCNYCYNKQYKAMYGITVAEIRPVSNVIEEIQELKQYPLELIFFQDDIFPIYKKEWLSYFCILYRKIHIPFHIQVRAEMLSEDIIKQLKDVGLHGVTFAIESGNTELRNNVLNRKMSDEVILKNADLLHKYGIKLRTENMIGFPGETWGTAMETLKLNVECKPDIGWASLYQPYPGTELGDKCIEDGLFDGDMDSISENFFDKYRIKGDNGKRFERLQKLFSLIVLYPRLRWFANLLTSLPFDRLYRIVYQKVKSFLYTKRLYKVG